MRLFHTTTLKRAAKIESEGFDDNGYQGEQPCTWWSSVPNGYPSDPAVFVVKIPDEVTAHWLDEESTVVGQYQDFRIPAEIVNIDYP